LLFACAVVTPHALVRLFPPLPAWATLDGREQFENAPRAALLLSPALATFGCMTAGLWQAFSRDGGRRVQNIIYRIFAYARQYFSTYRAMVAVCC